MPTGKWNREKSQAWQAYLKRNAKTKKNSPQNNGTPAQGIAQRLLAMGSPNAHRFYTTEEWRKIAENFDEIKGTPEGLAIAEIAIRGMVDETKES